MVNSASGWLEARRRRRSPDPHADRRGVHRWVSANLEEQRVRTEGTEAEAEEQSRLPQRQRVAVAPPPTVSRLLYVNGWLSCWMAPLQSVLSAGTKHRAVTGMLGEETFLPVDVHFSAKDILSFHAAIWPALLLALHRTDKFSSLELPRRIYAHSFWVSDGQKMSKSLGNFVGLARLRELRGLVGLDGLRYFLTAAGPLGWRTVASAMSGCSRSTRPSWPTASAIWCSG